MVASFVIFHVLFVPFSSAAVETQLISTGAFEITLNDMPVRVTRLHSSNVLHHDFILKFHLFQVWSKIEAGRIPQPGELFQIIENQMNMKVNLHLYTKSNQEGNLTNQPVQILTIDNGGAAIF